MRSIHERPCLPEDSGEAGHREGDLIVDKDQQSAIDTLLERDSDTLHDAVKAPLGAPPPELRRSITRDQRTEMARHLAITATLGAPVYFYDSRSPWEHSSNENANGLLCDYVPKGSTDLCVHSAEHPTVEAAQPPPPTRP